ncbi:MAG: ABC transporter permease [Promethearchaeota archaeon]
MGNPLVLVFLAVLGSLLALAVKERKLFRMSLRYISRHKGRNFLGILGIAVGVSMICATTIISDSFAANYYSEVDDELGSVDLTVTSKDGVFTLDDFERIRAAVLENESGVHVEGLAPRLILPTTAQDCRTGKIGNIQVVGFNQSLDEPFGEFYSVNDTSGTRDTITIEPSGGDGENGGGAVGCVIAEDVAVELGAYVGDNISLTDMGDTSVHHNVTVVGIAKEHAGKVAGIYSDALFLLHDEALELFFKNPYTGTVNVTSVIVVATTDYKEDSGPVHGALDTLLDDEFGDDHAFEVGEVKVDALDKIVSSTSIITLMLAMFSMLIVIGGVLLIVNTQAMAADERITEIGMMRSLGAYRKHVRTLFVLEGAILSLVGAAVGIGVGVGASYLLVNGLPESDSRNVELVVQPTSLVNSFVIGFLITLAMVVIPAVSISRVRVVTAVRGHASDNEPSRAGPLRNVIVGLGLTFLSVALLVKFPLVGSSTNVQVWITFGNLFAIGLGLALSSINRRVVLSATGVAMVVYSAYSLLSIIRLAPTIPGFFTGIVFLILALIVIISLNIDTISQTILGVVKPFSKRARSVVRIASKYLTRKRLRTTLTFSIFSFILCMTLVLQAVTSSFNANPELQAAQTGGGVDLVGTLHIKTNDSIGRLMEEFDSRVEYAIGLTSKKVDADFDGTSREFTIYGVHPNFTDSVKLHFLTGGPELVSRVIQDNWSRVIVSPDITELATGEVSDEFTMETQNNSRESFEIVGEVNYIPGLASFMSNMMLMSRPALSEFFPAEGGNGGVDTVLISVKSNSSVARGEREAYLEDVAHGLEVEFKVYGLSLTTVRDEVVDNQATLSDYTFFFILFTNIGLLIGIFGIMISNFRGIKERENTLGVLRAIGYRKRDIAASVVLETILVTLFGLIVGYISGLFFMAMTYVNIFVKFGFPLVIPWGSLAAYFILIVLSSTIAAYLPARKAAKLVPASALRVFD